MPRRLPPGCVEDADRHGTVRIYYRAKGRPPKVRLRGTPWTAEFMAAYFAVNVHAYANVGYVAGYYDRETADRIWRLCKTAHPIFGTREPTFDEAFDAGQRMAKEPRA